MRRHPAPPVPRLAALLAAFALSAVLTPPDAGPSAAETSAKRAEDLVVVDCLLPQKVRRLGRRSTYLAPRQPIRTTAADCRIRGGEYTEPDQANYATSLQVWKPQAEAGDAEAQYFVAQIFERGLGTTPDYPAAAEWYRRAAEQDYAPAQIGLGYLYEEGLGVEQDDAEALRWYRRAAGSEEDLVVLQEAEYQELVAARDALDAKEQEVRDLEAEAAALRRQLEETKAEASEESAGREALERVLARLEVDLETQRVELAAGKQRIAKLEKRIESDPRGAGGAVQTASLDDIPFGDYHALVIGNADYQKLPQLEAARREAQEIAGLLEERYGFTVRLLLDADRFAIMSALNELREELTTEDQLLVYYAGHGQRDADGQTAYWQPVDAAPDSSVNWIPSAVITEHLDLIASNHVFVVANSVFAGLRTRSSVARLPRGMTDEERYYHVKRLLEKRSRLVMTSGEDPVTASEGVDFASAFADSLRRNDGVLEASRLYQDVSERLVEANEDAAGLEFATLKWARGDVADFFFVPKSLR